MYKSKGEYGKDCEDFISIDKRMGCSKSGSCRWKSQSYEPFNTFIGMMPVTLCAGRKLLSDPSPKPDLSIARKTLGGIY